MKIKFQDLRVLDENLRSDLMNDLKESFEDGKYIAGDAVKNIENIFSEFFSSPEAVFTSSGTSALIICLQSLAASLSPMPVDMFFDKGGMSALAPLSLILS